MVGKKGTTKGDICTHHSYRGWFHHDYFDFCIRHSMARATGSEGSPQISIDFLGGCFFYHLRLGYVGIQFGRCIWVSSNQFSCRRFAHPQDRGNKLHIGHPVVTHLRSLQLSNGFICVLPWRGSRYLLEVVDDSTWCCMATCHNGWQCCPVGKWKAHNILVVTNGGIGKVWVDARKKNVNLLQSL